MKKLSMSMALITIVLFSAPLFASSPPVYHIALLKLKDGVTPEQIEALIISFNLCINLVAIFR